MKESLFDATNLPELKDIKKIALNYGLDSRLDLLIEECAELIQAVSKYKRYGKSSILCKNLIEEMADVFNVIDQLCYLLKHDQTFVDKCGTNLNVMLHNKVRRTLEQIDTFERGKRESENFNGQTHKDVCNHAEKSLIGYLNVSLHNHFKDLGIDEGTPFDLILDNNVRYSCMLIYRNGNPYIVTPDGKRFDYITLSTIYDEVAEGKYTIKT